MAASQVIEVFYDGACIICAREIDFYRRKDTDNKIAFIDISLPTFDAARQGLDSGEVNRVFHVRNRSGNIEKGVDGFISIWRELDSLRFLARLARFGVIRLILEIGYKGFVILRPYLPRKKCDGAVCRS